MYYNKQFIQFILNVMKFGTPESNFDNSKIKNFIKNMDTTYISLNTCREYNEYYEENIKTLILNDKNIKSIYYKHFKERFACRKFIKFQPLVYSSPLYIYGPISQCLTKDIISYLWDNNQRVGGVGYRKIKNLIHVPEFLLKLEKNKDFTDDEKYLIKKDILSKELTKEFKYDHDYLELYQRYDKLLKENLIEFISFSSGAWARVFVEYCTNICNNYITIQKHIRGYLARKNGKETKSIIIQKYTRGYLARKYVKNYRDFIKRAEEIIKEEQELKDLIKKYEEEVNRQNQEEFNKIFLQNLMATHTIPRHPEKDLLDTLSPKPSGSANTSPNTSPNNRNDTAVKLIGGTAAGTLAAVVATKIGAISVGVALSPFTGGWSLTLSYAF